MTEAPEGVHLWLVLWKAAHAVGACAREHIDSLALCGSDFGVLEALHHKGPLPVSVLGRKVLLASGSITPAVDRLTERGLVERRSDPRDRRVKRVHLTPAGEAFIHEEFGRHRRVLEEATSVLTARERRTLLALLKKWGRHAEGVAAGSGRKT